MERLDSDVRPYTVIDPSWGMALKVYWSFLWRFFFWVIPAGMFFAVIAGMIIKLLGGTDKEMGTVGALVMFFLMATMVIVVIKRLLRIRYRNFRIVTLAREKD